jgi:hypothetical protein
MISGKLHLGRTVRSPARRMHIPGKVCVGPLFSSKSQPTTASSTRRQPDPPRFALTLAALVHQKATQQVGLHRVGRHQGLRHMIASNALKRAQVEVHTSAMRASTIGAWHFGQAGVSITIGETLECCDFDSGMMLPSNWRERKTLCHR